VLQDFQERFALLIPNFGHDPNQIVPLIFDIPEICKFDLGQLRNQSRLGVVHNFVFHNPINFQSADR
jgi:hypothetical protein